MKKPEKNLRLFLCPFTAVHDKIKTMWRFSILILFFIPALAFAQTRADVTFPPRNKNDFMAATEYKTMVYSALAMKTGLNFGYFRTIYASMENYAPISDDLQRQILSLAYTIKNDPPSDARAKALDEYTSLILQHLANIDVVAVALSLSEENKKFGNPVVFKWIYRGLLESIMRSGDGARLSSAFNVVTLGEESTLLSKLGLKILDTTPGHEGSIYYNMYHVQDPKTKQPYTIFVETTRPMEVLMQQAEQQKTLNPLPDSTNAKIR